MITSRDPVPLTDARRAAVDAWARAFDREDVRGTVIVLITTIERW